MPASPIVIQPPTVEPVPLAEAMQHLRAGNPDEAAYIETLVVVARGMVEDYTGRALLTQQRKLTLPRFPLPCVGSIDLPCAPVTAVDSITYRAATTGAVTTLASSAYVVAGLGDRGSVYLADGYSWPDTQPHPEGVEIRFTAGAATPAAVPAPLRHAVLLLVSHLYELRTPVNVGNIVNEIPLSARHLMDSAKIGGWIA